MNSGAKMKFGKIFSTIFVLLLAGGGFARGQSTSQPPPAPPQNPMPGMQMPMPASPDASMQMGGMNSAGMYLMGRTSGTGANPESAAMKMFSWHVGEWNLMFHGEGFISDVQQTGPRGDDKFFSTNWFMGMAEHNIEKGAFTIRAMMSAEPATITKREYPELFQTGETAFGKALVDGQHPHDLFMELSVAYAQTIGEKTNVEIYFAPVGDPALGPVAFPHRVSAAELPQAPLGHHLQDSTHIANEVLSAALRRPHWGVEASGFHGAEPNANRWNIDAGGLDSWSVRLSWTPTANWSAQVSAGRLHKPEALEPGDQLRSTASVTYNRPFDHGDWATSVIWGRDHETDTKRNINSYLLESVVRFREKNYITGRVESVDRDELFADQPAIEQHLAATVGTVFRIGAFTAGYTRDVHLVPHVITGIGGNFTLYNVPSAIQPFYGEHPAAFYMFLRFRLEGKDGAQMSQQRH
jgi:hypothetical protein